MKALLAKSEGTFLWVSLAIEKLTHLSSGPDFKKILDELPLELEELYQEMLDDLTLRKELRVLSMIHSVALALRPLTFSELSYILVWMEKKAKAKQHLSRRTSGKIRLRTEAEIKKYVQSSLGFFSALPPQLYPLSTIPQENTFSPKPAMPASRYFPKARHTSQFLGGASDTFTIPSQTQKNSKREITVDLTIDSWTQV